jgi:hypothetical protein
MKGLLQWICNRLGRPPRPGRLHFKGLFFVVTIPIKWPLSPLYASRGHILKMALSQKSHLISRNYWSFLQTDFEKYCSVSLCAQNVILLSFRCLLSGKWGVNFRTLYASRFYLRPLYASERGHFMGKVTVVTKPIKWPLFPLYAPPEGITLASAVVITRRRAM